LRAFKKSLADDQNTAEHLTYASFMKLSE